MNKPNMMHVAETADTFQKLANDHGGLYVIEDKQRELQQPTLRYVPEERIRRIPQLREFATQGARIVPVGVNFDQLVQSPGQEFGLLKPGEGIFPAVITAQSRPQGNGILGQLYVAYLANGQDRIDPKNIGKGAGDPLNAMLLQTASTLSLPTIAAHGENGLVLPGELGHRYGGLRALSDPNTHEAILRGQDVADRLATSGKGLAANITQYGVDMRDRNIPGAFDMVDGGQMRRITYGIAVFGSTSTALLIEHPNFNADVSPQLGGMMPAIAATGLAIISKMSREEPIDPRRSIVAYGQQALGLR